MNQIAARKLTPRKSRAGAVAMALLLSAGLAACGDDGGSAASSTSPPAAASGATASMSGASGSGSNVSVINQVKFLNSEVRVPAGTAVEFDNQDSQPHTATSDNGMFDTGLIAAGAKHSVTFAKAGTFAYHCSLHPFMKAQIVVT